MKPTFNELLAWIAAVILILGGVSWIVIRYIITKAFQEIDKHREQIAAMELRMAMLAQTVGGNQTDIVMLKSMSSETNKIMSELNKTLQLFDINQKEWHKDIRSQNAEIKMSLDRSNNLVEQANKTYQEFIGVIKDLKKAS
jgi:hypothetical protein